jgi:hypothetical protein
LQKYNPSVRFTVYPDLGHNCWTVTYENDSLYQWLLQQKKFAYKAVSVDVSLLKRYTGTYADSERDTVDISLDKDKLFAKIRGKQSFELKPASETVFFIDANMPLDIRFDKSRAGKVNGFIAYENKEDKFERIVSKK